MRPGPGPGPLRRFCSAALIRAFEAGQHVRVWRQGRAGPTLRAGSESAQREAARWRRGCRGAASLGGPLAASGSQ